MFDYDARPITPQVVLVGNRASSVGYTIRDFWSRNGVPYEWGISMMPRGSERWSLRARWIPAYCRYAWALQQLVAAAGQVGGLSGVARQVDGFLVGHARFLTAGLINPSPACFTVAGLSESRMSNIRSM